MNGYPCAPAERQRSGDEDAIFRLDAAASKG